MIQFIVNLDLGQSYFKQTYLNLRYMLLKNITKFYMYTIQLQ